MTQADLTVFGRRGDAEGLALVVARSLPGSELRGRNESWKVSYARNLTTARAKPDLVVEIDGHTFRGSHAAMERARLRDVIVERMRGPGMENVLKTIEHVSIAASFLPSAEAPINPGDRMFSVIYDLAARTDGFCLDLRGGRVMSPTAEVLASTEQLLAEGAVPIDPSLARIGARLVVLLAVGARALTELDGRDVAEAREGINRWLGASGAAAEMEPAERAFLESLPGAPSDEQLTHATWQIEGAVVLAWAVELVHDLPPFDQPVDPALLSGLLLFPDGRKTRETLRTVKRRHQASVDDEAARHLAVHWRLEHCLASGQALDLVGSRHLPAGLRFDDVPMAGGDLAVAGQPVAEADFDTVEMARAITAERLHALAWLQVGGSYSTTSYRSQ
ncbi:MAG TPA: DUF4272 domain-containing protein [Acidimicrobiales bacterium]|nr:DUF4272 domain-containing protein [Acidimicrobiales bacterium]